MPRNLDTTALRAFVTVAETGGVTRAAGLLHLTQSAVSMQLKRLEEALGQPLLDRSGRTIGLTPQGEQVLGDARRLLAVNDEIVSKMQDEAFEGELSFGVPHDIVYPHIPKVLKRFAAAFPRVKVRLVSSFTRQLKQEFASGRLDLILTTEDQPAHEGEVLESKHLVWVGAPGGSAWRARPLRLAFETGCIFRGAVQGALESVDIPWEMAVDSESTRTIDATVSADLAVHANLDGAGTPYLERISHGGALPDLPVFYINLYKAVGPNGDLADALAGFVRDAYQVSELHALSA
ncbi:MAG: LysR family transcriptional regulator [Pseudomonadota bacterium]